RLALPLGRSVDSELDPCGFFRADADTPRGTALTAGAHRVLARHDADGSPPTTPVATTWSSPSRTSKLEAIADVKAFSSPEASLASKYLPPPTSDQSRNVARSFLSSMAKPTMLTCTLTPLWRSRAIAASGLPPHVSSP